MSTFRKIFNYNNIFESRVVESLTHKEYIYEKSISAGGCLFFRKNKDLELLLISYDDPNWPRLDDFGGRVDIIDDTIYNTIIRETTEETNNVINEKIMLNLIGDNKYRSFYNHYSKYFMIVIEVSNNFFNDTSVFGIFEKTDKISRTINWMKYSEIKHKLAHRLLNNQQLINYLDSLDSFKNKNSSS